MKEREEEEEEEEEKEEKEEGGGGGENQERKRREKMVSSCVSIYRRSPFLHTHIYTFNIIIPISYLNKSYTQSKGLSRDNTPPLTQQRELILMRRGEEGGGGRGAWQPRTFEIPK